MKNFRRIGSLLVAATAGLALAACTDSGSGGMNSESGSSSSGDVAPNTTTTADSTHQTVDVTADSFAGTVLGSDQVVLVDFWAEWCGPCKAVAPTLEELAGEYKGKVVIAKVNVDRERDLANQYRIRAIPNMKIFKNGQLVDEIVGAASKDRIEAKLNEYL